MKDISILLQDGTCKFTRNRMYERYVHLEGYSHNMRYASNKDFGCE